MKPMIVTSRGGGVVTNTVYVETPPPDPPSLSGVFGPGTLGDIVYSSNQTVSTDVDANNITINEGVTVTLAPKGDGSTPRFRFTGTFTILGTLSANGGNGTTAVAGTAGSAGGVGGTGGTPPSGVGGPSTNGLGGVGGDGSISGTANPGGTLTYVGPVTDVNDLVDGEVGGQYITGGTGGGAGYGTSPIGAGGGGGGGVVHLVGAHIVGDGTITAKGGDGGQKGASAGGNGGGGGGGVVIIVCKDIDPDLHITVMNGVFANDTPFAQSGTQGRIYVAAEDPTQSVNWQGMFTGVEVTFA